MPPARPLPRAGAVVHSGPVASRPMADMLPESDEAAIELAQRALLALIREDEAGMQQAIGELGELTSRDEGALQVALMTWADAYVQYVKPDVDPDAMAVLRFAPVEGGEELTADDVAPHIAWAGRWVVARGRMDRPTCDALYAALVAMPEDQYQRATGAVLQGVALTIRAGGRLRYPRSG